MISIEVNAILSALMISSFCDIIADNDIKAETG